MITAYIISDFYITSKKIQTSVMFTVPLATKKSSPPRPREARCAASDEGQVAARDFRCFEKDGEVVVSPRGSDELAVLLQTKSSPPRTSVA
jgi:hypothetical protein